jgi:hypothetical protein
MYDMNCHVMVIHGTKNREILKRAQKQAEDVNRPSREGRRSYWEAVYLNIANTKW